MCFSFDDFCATYIQDWWRDKMAGRQEYVPPQPTVRSQVEAPRARSPEVVVPRRPPRVFGLQDAASTIQRAWRRHIVSQARGPCASLTQYLHSLIIFWKKKKVKCYNLLGYVAQDTKTLISQHNVYWPIRNNMLHSIFKPLSDCLYSICTQKISSILNCTISMTFHLFSFNDIQLIFFLFKPK